MATRTEPRPAAAALPASARRAVTAMYVGLALTLIAALVPIIDQTSRHSLPAHLRDVYAGYQITTTPSELASGLYGYLYAIAALGVAAWLWMIWAITRHKRWVAAASTVIFALASVDALVNLLAVEYGRTILPTLFGVVGLLPCLAGLVTVILLWTRGRAVPAGPTSPARIRP